MRQRDGRAVPNFISEVLNGEPLTAHGAGSRTRSLCYVDDLIEGIWRLLNAGAAAPVNIGNPEEVSVLALAEMIRNLARSDSEIVFQPRPEDDPELRCPDITRARSILGWEPTVSLTEGIERTIEWARPLWG